MRRITPVALYQMGLYDALDIWFKSTEYQLTFIARSVRYYKMQADHKRGYMS